MQRMWEENIIQIEKELQIQKFFLAVPVCIFQFITRISHVPPTLYCIGHE